MTEPSPQVFLREGSFYCTKGSTVVNTVLGSCVSVCLWDPRQAICGINHFVLPKWNGEGQPSPRYGDVAIDELLAKMESFGSLRSDLEAKVFGGAAVFGPPGGGVGDSNVEYALAHLYRLGIPVTAKRTGGLTGVHLRLYTSIGTVELRPLLRLEDELRPGRSLAPRLRGGFRPRPPLMRQAATSGS